MEISQKNSRMSTVRRHWINESRSEIHFSPQKLNKSTSRFLNKQTKHQREKFRINSIFDEIYSKEKLRKFGPKRLKFWLNFDYKV